MTAKKANSFPLVEHYLTNDNADHIWQCSPYTVIPNMLRASIHWGDHTTLSHKSVGCHFVANSMLAILQASIQHPNQWTTSSLDTFMYEGHKLYSSIDTNHEFLLLSELPTHVSAYDCTYITNIKSECFGGFKHDVSVVHRLLHGALELTNNIYASKYGILCLGDTTGAVACVIIYSDDYYYIFDQHSRDRNGMPCENNTATVMHFSTRRYCVHYIVQLVVILGSSSLYINIYKYLCYTLCRKVYIYVSTMSP